MVFALRVFHQSAESVQLRRGYALVAVLAHLEVPPQIMVVIVHLHDGMKTFVRSDS